MQAAANTANPPPTATSALRESRRGWHPQASAGAPRQVGGSLGKQTSGTSDMLSNVAQRGDAGCARAVQLAAHQLPGLGIGAGSTALQARLPGRKARAGRLRIWSQESARFPASGPGGPGPRSFPEKKKNQKQKTPTLVLLAAIPDTFLRPEEERGGGGKFQASPRPSPSLRPN